MILALDYRMHRHTGVGTYLTRLMPQVVRRMPDDQFVLLVNPGEEPDNVWPANVRLQPLAAPCAIYSVKEQLLVPLALRQVKPDLFHCPHFNLPLAWPGPVVVTIHDLIYQLLPETCPGLLARVYARVMYRAACGRARTVLVNSECTGRDVRTHLGVPAERVRVTPLGAPPRNDGPARPGELESLRALGVEGPFVLYVGLQSPHKNLVRLIEAFTGEPELSSRCQLVLAGKVDPRRVDVARAVEAACPPGRVVRTGFVSDEALDALYRHASAFVLPSLYEGFGLPVLEAMARGTPVASSSAASLPEAAGDAAVYFDPRSIPEMRAAIRRVLEEPELAGTLRARGFEQLRRMSWERCAELTVEAYRAAAG